jgi:hypothetical protein
MHRKLILAAALACLSSAAVAPAGVAQTPDATPALAPSAAPLETLEITRAKGGGLQDETAAAGGYSMLSATTGMGVMGKMTVTVNARFRKDGADAKAKPEILHKAKCKTKAVENTPLWGAFVNAQVDTVSFSGIYACLFDGASPDAYTFEILMPPNESTSVGRGPLTVEVQKQVDPTVMEKAFAARLVYNGKLYEAKPVGVDPLKFDTRMMKGFTFTRDGAEVGGIDFVGRARNKGSIRAPIAGSDDREAVIYLAFTLLHMADSSSPMVNQLKYN